VSYEKVVPEDGDTKPLRGFAKPSWRRLFFMIDKTVLLATQKREATVPTNSFSI
jgi:hypothetical protein